MFLLKLFHYSKLWIFTQLFICINNIETQLAENLHNYLHNFKLSFYWNKSILLLLLYLWTLLSLYWIIFGLWNFCTFFAIILEWKVLQLDSINGKSYGEHLEQQFPASAFKDVPAAICFVGEVKCWIKHSLNRYGREGK